MTTQDQLNKYLEYLTARGQSINYLNTIKLWLNYLEEKKLEIFSQEDITHFFIEHSKYKDSSKCQFIKAGRHYYTQFLQVPKEQNEWFKIKLLKVPRKIPEYFTEANLEEAKKQLVIYHSNKMTPQKIRVILDFLYYTGVRRNELLTLKRKDINLENNTAKVYGKGDRERIVCYPEKVKKEIEKYFISENEENNAFNLTLAKLCSLIRLINKYCGIKIHCHSFRHGFAKNCLRKGVPLPTLSRLLGHASLATTMIYADPSIEEMKDTYQEMMNKNDK